MRWVRYVVCMSEMRNAHKIVIISEWVLEELDCIQLGQNGFQ
jgi:hypothetical protein